MKKKPVKYINHTAMQCLCCGEMLISWDRHNYVPCKCGKCAIDGGFDYTKVTGDGAKDYELYNIRIPKHLKGK